MKSADLIEFYQIYLTLVSWLIRKSKCENFDKDECRDIMIAMKMASDVFEEIESKYEKDGKSLEFDFDDFFVKFRDNMVRARYKSHLAGETMFSLLGSLNSMNIELVLNDYSEFVHTMDEEKAKSLNEKFNRSDCKAGDSYLLYRGVEFLLDERNQAYSEDGNTFQLEWDWWYPIDRYIFLERRIDDEE